ncbi:MAG: dephospho-CoA kinase [Nitrospirae bacterium]|nr:dephospho-CoA kinase [Nitrospirota bacterium]
MLVALTGGFGTGKSTVLEMFRHCGAHTLSADQIVHELLEREDLKREILEYFGPDILDTDGRIDRKALAERVFSSEENRIWLERLLHPEVFRKIDEFYRQHPEGITVVEIPLLYETSTEDRFDAVVVVYAPESKVKERLKDRGFNEEDISCRMKAQLDINEKLRRADYVVDNSSDQESTFQAVRDIYDRLRKRL